MPPQRPDIQRFRELAQHGNLVPVYRRLLSDRLTPTVAYRRLVRPDDRMAPSFLLESVVGGERQARYSFLGAQPIAEIIAHGHRVDRRLVEEWQQYEAADPLAEPTRVSESWTLAAAEELPQFTGGWVGYAGYDTVRYAEGEKLTDPPSDDRGLPDMHFGLYRRVVAFDHVRKTMLAINHVLLDEHASVDAAYEAGCRELDELVERIETEATPMAGGDVDLDLPPRPPERSNFTRPGYEAMVERAKEYVAAGDICQVVPSQRFERHTEADPFDVYRTLRVVNPSPYMFYLQARECILVGSSPEILCRVQDRTITNRPLAGTRRRGTTDEEDAALQRELLADPKERAEHIMLVDLARNDVGRVSELGTVELPAVMTIEGDASLNDYFKKYKIPLPRQIMHVERYSHVMHISSTVIGRLREGLTAWDALRATLPVGTVSGAPKIRAMQIIDELEPTRRGPYAGAVGYTDFAGNMDMAIALRTMVVTPADAEAETAPQAASAPASGGARSGHRWNVYLQAGGGVVADSDPAAEYEETVNKAAALAKAVDLAESTFVQAG